MHHETQRDKENQLEKFRRIKNPTRLGAGLLLLEESLQQKRKEGRDERK